MASVFFFMDVDRNCDCCVGDDDVKTTLRSQTGTTIVAHNAISLLKNKTYYFRTEGYRSVITSYASCLFSVD